MERFVYIDGVFWDRVCDTAEEVANSLGLKISSTEVFKDHICGMSERVELSEK